MQVSVETIDNLKRKMSITIPKDKIDDAVDKKLHSIKKTVNIDGFRPGKVPFPVVKKRFSTSIRSEIINDMIQSSYGEAINQEKIVPAGPPVINVPEDISIEDDFNYIAEFEIYPEITVKDLSSLEIEQNKTETNEQDLEEMLENLRSQHVTWKETDRAAQDGDQVTISFVGEIDGEKFEGGEAKDVKVIIGSQSMIEGFESGLINTKANEETVLNVSFPENYQVNHLAGKDAKFNTTVTKVEEPILPELNEEFANKLGVTEGGIEEVKSQIKNNLERECNKANNRYNKNKVMAAVAEAHKDLEVPEVMVDQEINQMIEGMKQQMQGQNVDELFKNRDAMKPEATNRVILGLVVSKIIEDNKIELDDEKVQEFIANESKSYEKPQDFIDYYNSNAEKLNEIKPIILESQVVSFIVEKAKINSINLSFQELIDQQDK